MNDSIKDWNTQRKTIETVHLQREEIKKNINIVANATADNP